MNVTDQIRLITGFFTILGNTADASCEAGPSYPSRASAITLPVGIYVVGSLFFYVVSCRLLIVVWSFCIFLMALSLRFRRLVFSSFIFHFCVAALKQGLHTGINLLSDRYCLLGITLLPMTLLHQGFKDVRLKGSPFMFVGRNHI